MTEPYENYLWDRSGTPDPDLARIDRALGAFRFDAQRMPFVRRRATFGPVVLAAAALLIAGISLAVIEVAAPEAPASPFSVCSIEGRVAVVDRGGCRRENLVLPGDVVSTDDASRARLLVGGIGSVELWPGSELAIALDAPHTDDAGYRLDLVRGTLEASIFAAPRLFQVGTPSGIAVDLGCIYTATVEHDGNTRLAVTLGRVSFESEGHRVLVPSRAECLATPRTGPGTPFWSDKDDSFRAAVIAIDRGDDPAKNLEVVLASEDERDTLTWFHLLQRVGEPDRARILKRIERVVELPPDLRLDLVAACDDAATERLKEVLDWRW